MAEHESSIVESERRIGIDGRSIAYVLRRTPRARGLRMTIDGRRGLVVSLPLPSGRGWAHAADRVETFIRERGSWVLRHLDRLERDRAEAIARGGPRDGGRVHYRGELHRVRVGPAPPAARRSMVERTGADGGDELVVRVASRERRPIEVVLEAWFRERADEAIARAIAIHGPALGVAPTVVVLRDPSSRWGSASKKGRLMFSWRLALAPPDALETVVVHELAHLRVFGHGPAFWKLVASRRPDHLAQRAWLRRHSHALHAALEPVDAEE